MIVLVYIVTIVAFCIGAWVLAFLFFPIDMLIKAITRKAFIAPTDPIFIVPFVASAVVLMYLIEFVWHKIGYEAGWPLIVILIAIHLIFGSAKGANQANQAQAWGTVVGIGIYGVLTWF